MKNRILTAVMLLLLAPFFTTTLSAQKVGFISSDDIRMHFADAKQADQRIVSIVEEWKRELESMKAQIEELDRDIKKNRLVWTDEERQTKERELEALKQNQATFAKAKFESDGEYDRTAREIIQKIEEKIYAASQEVAADEGYDIIYDKSVQPLPYSNPKYDLTVKVLKKLGVDTKALEKELQEKIAKDPRNASKESKAPPSRRKSRSGSEEPATPEKTTPTTPGSNEIKRDIVPDNKNKQLPNGQPPRPDDIIPPPLPRNN
jgi:outer membrane protein